MASGVSRERRIFAIARRMATRYCKRVHSKGETRSKKIEDARKRQRPLRRQVRNSKPHKLIAYDLETTSIRAGNPVPLYLTAHGDGFTFSGRLDVGVGKRDNFSVLADYLQTVFLTPENNGARFVAWNGNKFDVYFVAVAMLRKGEYQLKPYMTNSHAIRGLKVSTVTADGKKLEWEFLDGMAMTMGSVARSLKDFLKVFAPPEFQKLDGPDFERVEFDPGNAAHVAYAERDSIGLWHGMMKAQEIVKDNFGFDLQPTAGNLGMRIFQANMPEGVSCWAPPWEAQQAIRDHVMRGGFCECAKRYRGPAWKYDLNQAYAAAMREARLPGGRCVSVKKRSKFGAVAIYKVRGACADGAAPFYYVPLDTGRPEFNAREIRETWITSIEFDQLESEGWQLEISEGWIWDDAFSMSDMVNRLEAVRRLDPKSARGEMFKAIGNTCYGKFAEQLEGLDLVLSLTRPEGYSDFQGPEEFLHHLWFRIGEPQIRPYHQPQISAFITAHVRMVVRRAILQAPDAWLYADTDCVAFSRPVALDIDKGRYGAWKVESDGIEHIFLGKKIYCKIEGGKMTESKAKGLNNRKVTLAQMESWYARGEAPVQVQVQRNNFLNVMLGADMFRTQTRRGTSANYLR